ncbi:MAG: (2Fe-2S) ferredoxin domain-containing protein [Candidatus Sumerlaeia bacterium]
MSEPYYKYHVFFCTNQRDGDRPCCNNHNSAEMRDYAKGRTKELGIAGKGGVRINVSGCMGRCPEGPTVVVYPEGVWYSWKSREDVDEIIEEHLVNGRVVERLLMAR